MTRRAHSTAVGRRSRRAVAALSVAVLVAAAGCGSSGTSAPSTAGPRGGATSTSAPATTSPPSSSTLTAALDGAYQTDTTALATYRNVVSALGSVGPFPNIVTAEQQHVATITTLLTRHGLAVPAAGAGQPAPATLPAACGLGVTLEQQVISFYTNEIPKVAGYADVKTAFENLLAASRDSHLPAFQRCA